MPRPPKWNTAYGRDADVHHTYLCSAASICGGASSATLGLLSGLGSLGADVEQPHHPAFHIAQRLEHEVRLSFSARAIEVCPRAYRPHDVRVTDHLWALENPEAPVLLREPADPPALG